MSSNQHPMLNVAVKAARAAGAIINRAALDVESVRISQKQVNDFVTEVDHASEQAVIETLLGAYPTHGIWAEESGREHGNASSDHVWLIDPLDGTTNFIHGVPTFAVSIGLTDESGLVAGCVHDPCRDETFHAHRGGGAYLNGVRISCTPLDHLDAALIATGFPFRRMDRLPAYLAAFERFVRSTSGLRRAGAASLDLAYTACGRYDGFFEIGLSPWDLAGGALVVMEAGGLVTDVQGGPGFLKDGSVVAAGARLHAAMLAITKSEL
jgi:myo-inositol-1(or 4)-monophosphatase